MVCFYNQLRNTQFQNVRSHKLLTNTVSPVIGTGKMILYNGESHRISLLSVQYTFSFDPHQLEGHKRKPPNFFIISALNFYL